MRILVVDDDYVSRMKLKALLTAYGDCDTAQNGESALKSFKTAHKEKFHYQLITMDIEMPDMTGQVVVHDIRKWEEANNINESQKTKILMVTIKSNMKDIMSAFEEGCEWYLSKPVTPENLAVAMAKVGFMNE